MVPPEAIIFSSLKFHTGIPAKKSGRNAVRFAARIGIVDLPADDALLARGLRGEKIRLGRLQVFQSLFRARHNAFVVHFDLALVEKQQRRVGVYKAERRALGAYVRGDEKAVGAFKLLRDLRLGGLRDFGLLLRLGLGENVGDLRLGKPVLFREALGDAALGPLLAGLQRGEERRCDILRFRRSRRRGET